MDERQFNNCEVCGKPIPWNKSDYPKNYATKKYCSISCSSSNGRKAKTKILNAANKFNEKHGADLDEKGFIEHLYFHKRIPVREIAIRIGISESSVYSRIKKLRYDFRIDWQDIYESIRKTKSETEKEAFQNLWKIHGSLLDVSEFLGVPYSSLRVKFYELGILGKKLAKREGSVAYKMMHIPQKKLESMSIQEMKEQFGCCHQTAWMNRKLVLTKLKNEREAA